MKKEYSMETYLKEDSCDPEDIEDGQYVFGTPDERMGWACYTNDLDNLIAELYRDQQKTPLKVRVTIEVLDE